MKKIVLPSFGLVVISFIPMIFFRDENTWAVSGYIRLCEIILSFITLLFIVNRYKNVYMAGSITFGKAFGYGFKVALCYALMGGVIYFIYLKINEDSFLKSVDNAIEKVKQQRLETEGVTSASMEKRMNSMFAFMINPFVVSVLMLIGLLFYGTIYALISAAILKSKKETSFA